MNKNEIKLYKSPVVFFDDNCEQEDKRHTYWIGATAEEILSGNEANQLYGITSTILNYALGDAYAGWTGEKAKMRDAAAARGHNVHQDIEDMCTMGFDPLTQEGWNFRNLCKERGWQVVANEYIVSDEEMFASAIDLLFLDADGNLCIGDIKTYSESTAKTKKDRTALQCSIYKYMFHLHNDYPISHVYEIRLRDKEVDVTELNHIPFATVEELIDAYTKNDQEYKYSSCPDWYYDIDAKYSDLLAQRDALDKQIEEMKQQLIDNMQANNISTMRGNKINVSLVKGATKTTFDQKKFCEEYPDIAEPYYYREFDQKRFLKEYKEEILNNYITKKTGKPTIRITAV